MSKTFTYTKICEGVYNEGRDDYEEYGFEFDYEVCNEDLLPEIVNLLIEDYFGTGGGERLKHTLRCMINDLDLLDVLADCYEDSLKEIFEQEALDSYD